jgi:histidyl-tRNA synthetase
VTELGGKPTPAIGFSFGIERLLMVLDEEAALPTRKTVYVAGAGEDGLERATDIARSLRASGFRVEVSYTEASLRSQLKRANRLAAAAVVIAGEDEAARGTVTLRNMEQGSQEEVPLTDLEARIGALV